MTEPSPIAPGDIVSGLEPSELVEIRRVVPFGERTPVEGVTLESKREIRRPLSAPQLAEHDLTDHGPFWKLAQALFEVMPRDIEDWKLISALLGEHESLRTQSKRTRFL
jgi:hypothetical protein